MIVIIIVEFIKNWAWLMYVNGSADCGIHKIPSRTLKLHREEHHVWPGKTFSAIRLFSANNRTPLRSHAAIADTTYGHKENLGLDRQSPQCWKTQHHLHTCADHFGNFDPKHSSQILWDYDPIPKSCINSTSPVASHWYHPCPQPLWT